MNELEMCKAFAELEGVGEHLMHRGEMYIVDFNGDLSVNGVSHSKFNPITDQCLTFQATIDYEVFIDHRNERVFILSALSEETSADFEEGGIPKAIIECILKSKGLWKA